MDNNRVTQSFPDSEQPDPGYSANVQPGYYPPSQGYYAQGRVPVQQPQQPSQYGYPRYGGAQQYAQYNPYGYAYQQPYGYPGYPGYDPWAPIDTEEEEDEEEKKMGPGRIILLIVAIVLFVGAISVAGYILWTYWDGQHQYDLLAAEHLEVAESVADPTLASFNIDWAALEEKNPDIVAWVYVPDTIINYPVVWRENDDNYYMKHNFGMNSAGMFGAEYGCIALASVNSPKFTDQASFMSGHHMRNGSMFALLSNFVNSDDFNEHRTFYVLTPGGNFRLTTFACDKVLGSSNDIIVPNFETPAEFQQYIQARMDDSKAEPDPASPPASQMKQIMMFYTCSEPDNQYRICVYANVDEFVPAGTNVARSNSLVDEDRINAVADAAAERVM